ncbi:DUF6318 family protein [uncultured Rothia sp.]|uniref:DUF6318 family protein n=1 Tax=uncultured Rothia sp. TaxID=316088 RepID=UPI0028D7121C|nr:DUF6318 family protein [uncultured Rothia sp.]
MSNHDEQTTENSAGRAPLVSRRAVAALSVGAAGVIVGQSVGLFDSDETRTEKRKKKIQEERDQAFIRFEPAEKYDALLSLGSSYGPLVYTAYERKGRFIPATEKQAAQNVPYPVMQPGIDAYNRGGLYIFIAYFCSAVNYFYHTGDTEPLSRVVKPEDMLNPELLRLYQEKRGWVMSSDEDILGASVRERLLAGDFEKNTKRNIFSVGIDFRGAKDTAFYIRDTGEKISFNISSKNASYILPVEHLRGRWVFVKSDMKKYTPLYPPGFEPIEAPDLAE